MITIGTRVRNKYELRVFYLERGPDVVPAGTLGTVQYRPRDEGDDGPGVFELGVYWDVNVGIETNEDEVEVVSTPSYYITQFNDWVAEVIGWAAKDTDSAALRVFFVRDPHRAAPNSSRQIRVHEAVPFTFFHTNAIPGYGARLWLETPTNTDAYVRSKFVHSVVKRRAMWGGHDRVGSVAERTYLRYELKQEDCEGLVRYLASIGGVETEWPNGLVHE